MTIYNTKKNIIFLQLSWCEYHWKLQECLLLIFIHKNVLLYRYFKSFLCIYLILNRLGSFCLYRDKSNWDILNAIFKDLQVIQIFFQIKKPFWSILWMDRYLRFFPVKISDFLSIYKKLPFDKTHEAWTFSKN